MPPTIICYRWPISLRKVTESSSTTRLGCGKSDVPRDKQLFVPERYVEEVEAFRKHLKLESPRHRIKFGAECSR